MQAEHPHTGPRSRPNGATSARLGGARADFVAGLGKKVADLRATLLRVRGAPGEPAARDELRRKLHALDSGAKMLKFDAMDRGLAEALGSLDRSSRERDGQPGELDLDAIEQVIEDLPALAWGDGRARSSRAEAADRSMLPKYDVLVVGSSLIAEALLDDSPSPDEDLVSPPPWRANFACQCTPDAQAAYDLIRTTEPDLLILDADLGSAGELVEALMDDPLTETVPIIVVGSFLEQGEAARYVAMGVAKTIAKPTSREALRTLCEDTLSPDKSAVVTQNVLGEPTLEELGDRLAHEIREAIVGRVDPSVRGRRIPLGQGTEVLGAVWGAIARIREVVTSRSDGHVRFGVGPEGALTPAPLLLDPDVARADRMRNAKRGVAAEVRLQGRRIVVADDDPGVVWFLADLLKTAGCIVHEAFDGRQALELAYKTSPDLVISDILMPHLDGFSLCRALRRDVALRDTPVILLSWKEDLLQRVRELGANAAGYVRKESDTRAIIARVREALRARGRIEARLREEGEVRGRLDGVSIRTLLEVVCATRPEARVSVRDATFLYEVEIRFGAPQKVTRTDGDGGFMKGSAVLAQLLGVSAGRFTVTTSTGPVEADLDGNLAAQLAKPIARARAAMGILTGIQTQAISRLRLDEPTLADYLKATPERARLVARRLANGAAPRELVSCGGCEPALLDDLLCDLAARGIVLAVEGMDGEDMLFPAAVALLQHSDSRASFAPRTATPSPIPALSEALVACVSPSVPICIVSPSPGPASLEDAVLREMSSASPEPPKQAMFRFDSVAPQVAPVASAPSAPAPRVDEITGTPPVEQILALAEPTIVDDVVYHEHSVRLGATDLSAAPVMETPNLLLDGESEPMPEPRPLPFATAPEEVAFFDSRHEPTPFTSETSDDGSQAAASKAKSGRRAWPMVAFLAASGIVAWAVLHFSTSSFTTLPRQLQRRPPPVTETLPPPAVSVVTIDPKVQAREQDRADEVYYTAVAAEATLPAGHGVLDVSAPDGSVVLVDGKERGRGSATLPMSSGNHDVRVKRPSADEAGCTIDVRTSRVAHVKF